jgi:hypothetical protein
MSFSVDKDWLELLLVESESLDGAPPKLSTSEMLSNAAHNRSCIFFRF